MITLVKWQTAKSITDGDNEYSYTYDENGIRTSKTVNGVTTYYNTSDGVILSQTDGTNTMYFQYDANGTPLGFIYNGTQYLYMTNQMGDVIGLTKANGEVFAAYVYDEWGSLLSIQTIDSVSQEDLAAANSNPLRYRGYYYDTETGYYYLQSRYYDPSICRFINADVLEISGITKDTEIGTNMFAYCSNDPINSDDPTGLLSKINAAILLVMFITYYVAKIKLKGYKFITKKIYIDPKGYYIAKIQYYKSKVFKKSFIITLSDRAGWKKATNVNNNLNMNIIQNNANYIMSESIKGATTSLNNKGPNVTGIQFAAAVNGVYTAIINIKTKNFQKIYNWIWSKKGLSKNKYTYYLFRITKGGNKLNGWYAYRSNGKETKY